MVALELFSTKLFGILDFGSFVILVNVCAQMIKMEKRVS